MKFKLAFYRGTSFFPSRLIRWFTWGPYSHVAGAIIYDDQKMDLYDAWDVGGVRKVHGFGDGHKKGTRLDLFTFYDDLNENEILGFIKAADADLGRGYDWKGVLSQIFRIRCHDAGKLFCSEAILNWLVSSGRILINVDSWKSSPSQLATSPEIHKTESFVV